MAKNRKNAESDSDIDVETAEAETAEVAEEADTDGLVKMHKNGESLHVHPTTVAAHEEQGWKVA